MEPETRIKNDIPSAVSAADIARALERTPAGVRKAIRRLGIEPIGTVGTISIYPAITTERVGAAMRRRNLTT
jgi:hypothetical protein